jgi:hypothetical protein
MGKGQMAAFRVKVKRDEIGIMTCHFGSRHPGDKYTVKTYGSPGVQAKVLLPEQIYYPSPKYQIEFAPVTVVPPGTIGVVVALAGSVAPVNRTFAIGVDCDSFQDGVRFLREGGQMGRQLDVLGAGKYNINPYIFEVLTVDTIGAGKYGLTADDLKEVSVREGTTGVVVALEGERSGDDDHAPGKKVAGHESFQLGRVFLDNGGQRGAQSETLGPGGVYRINPWFARVIIIPTREIILEWTKKHKPDSNYDSLVDRITVNVEGFVLHCEIQQIIRIPASSAPKLVQRFGEVRTGTAYGSNLTTDRAPVQRFVEKVLGSAVEKYFYAAASECDIERFLTSTQQMRNDLEDRVKRALDFWGVEAIGTTLSEFEADDQEINDIRKRIVDTRMEGIRLNSAIINAGKSAQIERINIATERERRKLEVVPELERLNGRMEILGRDYAAWSYFMDQLKDYGVPTTLITDAASLEKFMPLAVANNLLDSLTKSGQLPPSVNQAEPEPELPEQPEQPEHPSAGS